MSNTNPSYTKSTAAGTGTGASWVNAFTSIANLTAADLAGEVQWVSQSHAETANSPTYAGAGTNASPTLLLCGNDANTPPTAMATGATITPASGAITINGSVYAYGISFVGNGSGIKLATAASDIQRYESCNFHCSGSATFIIGPPNSANVTVFVQLVNCGIKQLSSGANILISGRVEILGGSILAGATSITGIGAFILNNADRTGCDLLVSGFDFTNQNAGMCLATVSNSAACAKAIFRNCKLPASWSGTLITGTPGVGQRVSMYNCDATNTNYRIWVEDFCGSIKSETTIVRTSGASDGTTPLSWKMVSNANAVYPCQRLVSDEIVIWNDTTGSAKTVTVEVIHSGIGGGTAGALLDSEMWLEVDYLGDASFPESTLITDCKADYVATAADQASSSNAWTSSPATPVKQALSVTFTPNKKGYIHARVVLAKASKTVYVDPMLTVT